MPEREIFDSVANETTVINIPDMYANTDEDTLWYVNNVYSPYRDSGMEAASQDPDHPLSGIPDAFARGFYRLGQGANALQVQLGLDNPENAAKEIQQYQKYIEQVPYDKEVLDSLNNIVEAESIGEIWDEVTTLPGLRAVGNVVGESLAQFTPAFAAMLAALPFTASGIALGAIAGLGSLSVEVQGTLLEEMQKYLNENNEDISDDKAVANLLGDEERMAEFSTQAAKRGIPIGLIDGLSVGFAGKIAASLSKSRRSANKALEAARKKEAKASKVKLEDMPEITPKSKIPERLAFAAEALALQPAAGGLGEAVAQQVAGEGFQLGPVALEFIAEIPGGTAETGIGMALANRRENKIIELEETQKKLHSKALNERKKAKANQQLVIVEEDMAGARDKDGVRYVESYEDTLYNSVDNIQEGEVAFTRGSIKKLFGLKSAKAVDAVINHFVNRGTVVKSKGKYIWSNKARRQRNQLNTTQIKRNENQLRKYLEGRPEAPVAPIVAMEQATEVTPENIVQAQLEEAPVTPVKTTEDVGPITPDDFKATEVEEAVVEETTPTEETEGPVFYRGVSGKGEGISQADLGAGVYVSNKRGMAQAFADMSEDGKVEEYRINPDSNIVEENSPEFIAVKEEVGLTPTMPIIPLVAEDIRQEALARGIDGVVGRNIATGIVIYNPDKITPVRPTPTPEATVTEELDITGLPTQPETTLEEAQASLEGLDLEVFPTPDALPQENIEVEFFIVKRKLYENVEFVQKRVQEFIPASGRNKTNKATKALSDFLSECFDSNGKMKDKEHPKFVGKQCDWCVFSEKGICRK